MPLAELNQAEFQTMLKLPGLGRNDLRITDISVTQELSNLQGFKGINLTLGRESAEYRALISELENVKPSPVGRNKGVNDRQIVADAFFAEGTKPTFITADKGIYNPLFKLSGENSLGKSIPAAFPNGFNVQINGKSLFVIPIKGK